MKRRLLSILLTLTLVLSILTSVDIMAVLADPAPWAGSGTKDEPYLIYTKEDLWRLSEISNSGEDLTNVYFKQKNDIDLGDSLQRAVYSRAEPSIQRHLHF